MIFLLNTFRLIRDIYEEYVLYHDVALYKKKTLETPLKHTFLYMRGELLLFDIVAFLNEYTRECEPWLLTPPPPGENFLAEIAFLTKYIMYDIDTYKNGVKCNFTRGLFGTTPDVTVFGNMGRWLNPYVFISSKGTFNFDATTDKITFGCINTFIA